MTTNELRLHDALAGLVIAVTREVNEKGGGGFVLARLSDARDALQASQRESLQAPAPVTPETPPRLGDVLAAANNTDWQQVVLNGGPPCFHFDAERGKFCLAAHRWAGHGKLHPFTGLADMIGAVLYNANLSVIEASETRPTTEEGAPRSAISGGAVAGLVDLMGGDSGATVVKITDHEVMDMAISGQAYSLDGKYNFRNESQLLDKAWAVYEAGRTRMVEHPLVLSSSPPPEVEQARRVLVNTVSGYTGLMAAAGPKELPQVIGLIDVLIDAVRAESSAIHVASNVHTFDGKLDILLAEVNDYITGEQDTRTSPTIMADLVAALAAQAQEIETLRAGLNAIASWSEGETVNTSFDEPYSAQQARDTLKSARLRETPE